MKWLGKIDSYAEKVKGKRKRVGFMIRKNVNWNTFMVSFKKTGRQTTLRERWKRQGDKRKRKREGGGVLQIKLN